MGSQAVPVPDESLALALDASQESHDPILLCCLTKTAWCSHLSMAVTLNIFRRLK